jgi:hypothetical protein
MFLSHFLKYKALYYYKKKTEKDSTPSDVMSQAVTTMGQGGDVQKEHNKVF